MAAKNFPGLKIRQKMDIFIIENQRGFIHNLVDFLSRQNNASIVGITEKTNLAFVEIAALKPDLVLYGMERPGQQDIDTIRQIRSVLPSAKIIGLFSIKSERMEQAALLAGADNFISKLTLQTDLPVEIFNG